MIFTSDQEFFDRIGEQETKRYFDECYKFICNYKNLGEKIKAHRCAAPDAESGYKFSKAMTNPGFIGIDDIRDAAISCG